MSETGKKEYMAYGFWHCAGFHDMGGNETVYAYCTYPNASPNEDQSAGWTWRALKGRN